MNQVYVIILDDTTLMKFAQIIIAYRDIPFDIKSSSDSASRTATRVAPST